MLPRSPRGELLAIGRERMERKGEHEVADTQVSGPDISRDAGQRAAQQSQVPGAATVILGDRPRIDAGGVESGILADEVVLRR